MAKRDETTSASNLRPKTGAPAPIDVPCANASAGAVAAGVSVRVRERWPEGWRLARLARSVSR